jgi:hypothetical protein
MINWSGTSRPDRISTSGAAPSGGDANNRNPATSPRSNSSAGDLATTAAGIR